MNKKLTKQELINKLEGEKNSVDLLPFDSAKETEGYKNAFEIAISLAEQLSDKPQPPQPPRTQGDKIRAMNNRELAEYLCEKYYCTNCSIYKNSKCKDVTECWSYYSTLVLVNREVKEDE